MPRLPLGIGVARVPRDRDRSSPSALSVEARLALSRPGGRLPRDPLVDTSFEHIERKRAGVEHRVVEGPYVVSGAELFLGPGAKLEDLQLPDHVGERLSGIGDVAIGLRLDFDLIDGRMR